MEKEMVFAGKSGSGRDLRLDNVKGLLIVLVVVGHFLLPLFRTRFITDCIYAIYVFHMPCFVMLSGYYAKSIYKNGSFRWIKLVELLWLYFLFKMLVNIPEGMLAGNIPAFPDFFHESGAPWYLLAMFFWYSTIPAFHRIKSPISGFICVMGITAAVIFGKYMIGCNDFLSMDRVLSFAPFFYIGYFCSEGEYRRFVKSKVSIAIAVFGFMLLVAVFFLTYDMLFKYHLVVYGADYHRYDASMTDRLWLINLIWYAVAFLISAAVIRVAPSGRLPFITRLGQNTLQIYILHRPIRDLCQYYGVYEYINPHNKIDVLILILASALLTVLLGNNIFAVVFKWIRMLPGKILLHSK